MNFTITLTFSSFEEAAKWIDYNGTIFEFFFEEKLSNEELIYQEPLNFKIFKASKDKIDKKEVIEKVMKEIENKKFNKEDYKIYLKIYSLKKEVKEKERIF